MRVAYDRDYGPWLSRVQGNLVFCCWRRAILHKRGGELSRSVRCSESHTTQDAFPPVLVRRMCPPFEARRLLSWLLTIPSAQLITMAVFTTAPLDWRDVT